MRRTRWLWASILAFALTGLMVEATGPRLVLGLGGLVVAVAALAGGSRFLE